jgi:branched-chain amino acid transport system ATP-binding protein
MLSVHALSAGYGPIQILHAVSIDVARGEAVTLIGWSGSGKTTLLKAIVGLIRPSAGNVLFEDHDVTFFPPDRRVKLGMALVPEGRRLFKGLSVYENILVGGHTVDTQTVARQMKLIFELFPVLHQRREQIAGTLSGGEQQMVAIARALMSAPRMLMVDELSLGLAPLMVQRLSEAIDVIRRIGTAIILVEQDAALALAMTDRAYVIQAGRIIRTDASTSFAQDADIRRDYFPEVIKA